MANKPVKKPAAKPAPKAIAPTAKAKVAAKPAVKAKPVPASKSPVPVKTVPPAKIGKTFLVVDDGKKKSGVTVKAAPAKAVPAKAVPAKAVPVKAAAQAKPAASKPVAPAKAAAKAAPAAAKRGPKAKGEPEIDDIDLSDVEADITETAPAAEGETVEKVKPLRMKLSKAKERALMKEFGLDDTVLSEEDLSKRRLRLKALITLGKTRGYLTHGEISDHLPDKLVDAETLDVVHSLLNDMGVAVYEQTPDAETLLLNNNAPTAASVEEAEEEAEAALSTVDSEFGRTTDPVRMYMREMGTVELLTREGEIEIAKRIEGGLNVMMEAISNSPATIQEVFNMMQEIADGKVVISTVVDGFSNPNEADDFVAEEDFDEYDEADDDDGKGGSKAMTKKLEELKQEAFRRFEVLRGLFEKLHKIYDKEGYGTPAYIKAQQAVTEDLMQIRFTAKSIEKLCNLVRSQVDDVRKKERELRRILVDKCHYPQPDFIRDFSGRDKSNHKVESPFAGPQVDRKASSRRQTVVNHDGPLRAARARNPAKAD